MKNPSLLLLVLMGILASLGFFAYVYWDSLIGLIVLFAGVILGGSIMIFKKEVNLYVSKRNAQSLSEKETQYLKDNFQLLKHIPATKHPMFYRNVHLFILDKEIISQEPSERIYHPAVLLCGAYAAFFEMKKSTSRVPFPKIPVYVFYGHPFPSPQFPKELHISEYFEEDGALLFSVPHLIKGNEDPTRFLNTVLYESARVALTGLFDSVDLPSLEELCKFGGFTIRKMEEYVGLSRDHIDLKAFALSLYFSDVKRFTKTFPRLGELFEMEFVNYKSY